MTQTGRGRRRSYWNSDVTRLSRLLEPPKPLMIVFVDSLTNLDPAAPVPVDPLVDSAQLAIYPPRVEQAT